MWVGTNKRYLVSSRPRRGCLHARTRTDWVTNTCDLYSMVKGLKSDATQTVLARQRRVLLVGSNTPRGGIAGKPNHDTVPRSRLCLPPCVALCNSRSARTPCVPQPLCPAIKLPQCRMQLHCRCLPHLLLLLACPNQKLRGRSQTSWRTGD